MKIILLMFFTIMLLMGCSGQNNDAAHMPIPVEETFSSTPAKEPTVSTPAQAPVSSTEVPMPTDPPIATAPSRDYLLDSIDAFAEDFMENLKVILEDRFTEFENMLDTDVEALDGYKWKLMVDSLEFQFSGILDNKFSHFNFNMEIEPEADPAYQHLKDACITAAIMTVDSTIAYGEAEAMRVSLLSEDIAENGIHYIRFQSAPDMEKLLISASYNPVIPIPNHSYARLEINTHGLTWEIAPVLEYEGNVYYCPALHHGFFNNKGAIDIRNGFTILGGGCGHGAWTTYIYYDAEKDVFGVSSGDEGGSSLTLLPPGEKLSKYPFSKWEQLYPFSDDTLITCMGFDSTTVNYIEEHGGYYAFETIENNQYAVLRGDQFLTGFDYTAGERLGHRYLNSIIAVAHGDKWGIIDLNGHVVVPFILEHAITIDNKRAFAKIDGKYGIVIV